MRSGKEGNDGGADAAGGRCHSTGVVFGRLEEVIGVPGPDGERGEVSAVGFEAGEGWGEGGAARKERHQVVRAWRRPVVVDQERLERFLCRLLGVVANGVPRRAIGREVVLDVEQVCSALRSQAR